MSQNYSAADHDGKRLDGQPDQRLSSEHGFGSRREEASEAGKVGGKTQPSEVHKPSEHDGLKKDGTPDARMSSSHGFGADPQRASEEGKKGGSTSA